MRDDEQEITDLIHGWVSAVRSGDLEGVLSTHAEDIVMFDVPPPDDGVRGIDAYRETWPPFFGWLRSGGSFEMVELGAPRATTSPTRGLCCGAEPRLSFGRIRTSGCA